jgi:predicted ATPase
VLTSRKDWTLEDAHPVETIQLGPLTVEECITLFQTLAGPQLVPPFVRDELLARSDGVPLFVEELTRVLMESTATGVAVATIPDTLQGLLLSRLDRLSPGALENHAHGVGTQS